MSYTVLVFVKQVPDTQNISGDAMTPEGTVNRAALPAIFNPEDLNALELALQLKDRYGAKVIVATMGMPAAAEVLRQSLYRGADEAVLVTDRALAGADTLATSYTLSCCANKIGNVDLILCGRQAIDGDTAQVGPQIAEKLKMPQICYVEEVVELKEKTITAKRAIDGGYEILQSPLPCLLTVIDSNDPRPMNARKIMKYKRAQTKSEVAKSAGDNAAAVMAELESKGLLISEYSAADINADPARIGFPGSPTKVKNVQSVILTASEAKSVPATADGIAELMHELISDHTLG
ncbi:MAG: electron transfer flavoprotein subunit beta/FixA family protein [Lentisphaeria bacterium]|nr:electron transfer flavoprotein subunit beta/FixA family protein [Lentisphaeria bacterium]MBQ8753877.1 electron transfer flavoprotein subunit beta/FixA family protein [Lentisphaeria bacterium]MBQ9775704.1 electron transfer flavoprotein subunit beta/FixA family protein [Lentisphaeria bacterium]